MDRGLTTRDIAKIHGPTIAYAALIFGLSSIPSLRVPDIGLTFQDKLAHALEFGVFGCLLERSFEHGSRSRRKAVFLAFMVGTVYAGLDEIHQLFVAGRDCSLGDFIWDVIGIGCVLTMVAVFRRLYFFR
jgi:VanZ family protein